MIFSTTVFLQKSGISSASKQKISKVAEESFVATKKDFLDLQKAQSLAEHSLRMKIMLEEHELKQVAIREEIRASQLKAE